MRFFKQLPLEESRRAAFFRAIVIAAMIAVTVLYFCLPALAQTKYVITDGDNVIVCMSSSDDPQVVIQEAGLELGESDTYTTQTNDGVSEIHINRIQMIAVYEGSQMTVVGSYGGTVADILEALDLTLAPTDMLSCSLDSETYDGMSIRITRKEVKIEEYDEIIPHTSRIYEDSSLAPEEELVLVEGADGLTHYQVQVTYEDGKEVGRTVLSEQVVTPATDTLILCGVDRSIKEQTYDSQSPASQWAEPVAVSAGTSTDSAEVQNDVSPAYVPGTDLTYTNLLYCNATAYTCQNESGITATGTVARVGAIAVDPNVIPLGTKMYIVSADGQYVYGYCVAEDTGGAIKGNRVDLYFDDYDTCIQFGYRGVIVYILE